MKKVILFLLLIIILGGCGGVKGQETKSGSVEKSDAAALQDEFTSEFIDSTKEVEEGYLGFKSKAGGYTMLYPKDAIAHPTSYETNGNRFEALKFGAEIDSTTSFYVNTTYEWSKDIKDTETYLYLLSSQNGYEGEYKKVDSQGKNIYIATDTFTYDTEENSSIYSVFGFVQSKNSNQAVSYEYNLVCQNGEKECSYDENEVKDETLKLMESITFITPKDED